MSNTYKYIFFKLILWHSFCLSSYDNLVVILISDIRLHFTLLLSVFYSLFALNIPKLVTWSHGIIKFIKKGDYNEKQKRC